MKDNIIQTYKIICRGIYSPIWQKHLDSLGYILYRMGEIELSDDFIDHYSPEHTALAHSSIFLSICFLDTTINDFFWNNSNKELKINDSCSSLLNGHLNAYKEGEAQRETVPLLSKYWDTIKVFNKNFNTKTNPYRDIELLIKLRNNLIHLQPQFGNSCTESIAYEDEYKARFSMMRGSENSANPFFPDKCFGYGCTSWAIRSILDFVKLFYKEIHLNEQLATLDDFIKRNETLSEIFN